MTLLSANQIAYIFRANDKERYYNFIHFFIHNFANTLQLDPSIITIIRVFYLQCMPVLYRMLLHQ